MSLNFFSASLSFGLAFRSGSVSLMVLNNSGLRGLKVVTNARMFSSAESFDFGSSSSCLGILFASSILWRTRPLAYPCLHKFSCSSCVFLKGFFFVYDGANTLSNIEWDISFDMRRMGCKVWNVLLPICRFW